MPRLAPILTLVPAILLSAAGAVAKADSKGSEADTLFEEGVKLLEAHRTHEACVLLERSLKIDPAPGTLQNLAICHEEEGKTGRAYAEFVQLAEEAAQSGQRAREALGRQRAMALVPRLARLALRFGLDANVAEIRLDDAPVAPASWRAPVVIDPGSHTLVFAAPAKRSVSRTFAGAIGTLTPVEVPHLDDAAEARSSLTPGGIAVGSIGLAAIVVGGIFGGLTFTKKSESDAHCTGQLCDQQGVDAMNTAYRYATASTALITVGIAAAGTGAFLFFWDRRAGTPSSTARVTPHLSVSLGGLHVGGSF